MHTKQEKEQHAVAIDYMWLGGLKLFKCVSQERRLKIKVQPRFYNKTVACALSFSAGLFRNEL